MRHVLKISDTAKVSEDVAAFIRSNSLFGGVCRLGLAVSGGSDSMALLHIVADAASVFGVTPVVLHFDHSIRGDASVRDAEFVRDAASGLNLEYHTEKAVSITAGNGLSLEMAARAARQKFFRRAVRDFALDAIATGHQADDVAETLVMRLLRGAGSTGLSGVRPVSVLPPSVDGLPGLRFIRPLLKIRRDTLRAWLSERKLSWHEDITNDDTEITRNNVRHAIIPAIESLTGGRVVDAFARSADIIREEDNFLDGIARNWLNTACGASSNELDIATLSSDQQLCIQRRVVRQWLMESVSPDAAGFDTVDMILDANRDDVFTLPGGIRAELNDGILSILHSDEESSDLSLAATELSVPGRVEWNGITLKADFTREIIKSRGVIGRFPAFCTISADAVMGRALTVRSRMHGDRMRPFGIDGSRKVQDIFTDAKLPEILRDCHPLIFCGDELVWIPGYRIAAKYAITDNTKTVIKLTAER